MEKPKVYLYNGEGGAVNIEGLNPYETKEAVEDIIKSSINLIDDLIGRNLDLNTCIYIVELEKALKKAGYKNEM